MKRQISEIVIHEDGRREAIFQRLGPNGETHSQELHNAMAAFMCSICNRLMSEHTRKEFSDHLDERRRQQGWPI